jgi:soluble epoxide hydrolase/lipid-phosphate phosphatase
VSRPVLQQLRRYFAHSAHANCIPLQDDYHLLVPDLRGFGWSSHPGDPENSGTIPDNVDDLVCLLEAAGVKQAVCIGHDWGAQICWQAARQRPDLFEAVAGTLPVSY